MPRVGRCAPPFRYTGARADDIEVAWQDRWAARAPSTPPTRPAGWPRGSTGSPSARSAYVMDMFPYPSGAGLHVGHPLGYIGTDVYARYLRMRGDNVLHTMGFDAFGLPAEQYAVQTGQHPRTTTETTWSVPDASCAGWGWGTTSGVAFATTDPEYYRWTQWIFLQIFNSWYDTALGQGPSDRGADRRARRR